MARGPIPYIVQKTNGDAVSGATISVAIRGAGPATIYANETGGTLASSPLLTDVDGKVTAWLDEGSYDVTASGAGITTTVRALEVTRGDTTTNRLTSPTLTGVPVAPTAAVDTNTTQLATTAFVVGQAGAALPLADAIPAVVGTSLRYSRQDHVHPLSFPVVTSLPGSPTDGQLIYFQTATMITAGVGPWLLRYRSGSASAYKWEVVGAVPWQAEVTQGENSSNAAFVDLATVGPSIVVPVAGDYVLSWGAHAVSGGGVIAQIGPNLNGTAPDPNVSVNFTTTTAGSNGSRSKKFTGIVAGSTTKLQYAAPGGGVTTTFFQRWLSMTPIRVG